MPQAPLPPRYPLNGAPESNLGDIHQQLDAIARQIDRISRMEPPPAPPVAAPQPEADITAQINRAIAQLDQKIEQLIKPAAPAPMPRPTVPVLTPAEQRAAMVERAAQNISMNFQPAPPLQPQAPQPRRLDFSDAVAQLTQRRAELDAANVRPAPPAMPAPAPMSAPAPRSAMNDISGLERQLQAMTAQIEQLRKPSHLDAAIKALREELADIRQALTEALPRRALDQIEGDIRSLAMKINESRQMGADALALGKIEQSLADIYQTLRTLTPAEQLAGYDQAIRTLSTKIEQIVHTPQNADAIRQLESTINALRDLVSHVASSDALARLSDDVAALAAKVDHLAANSIGQDKFAALEMRITALTAAIESREPAQAYMPAQVDLSEMENAVRALAERIDRLEIPQQNYSRDFAQIESRISGLLQKLDNMDARFGRVDVVEKTLAHILVQVEQQRDMMENAMRGAGKPASPADANAMDSIRREIADLRVGHSESERRTQDSLEVVHGTLGHVVDRLAMMETDLRAPRTETPMQAPLKVANAPNLMPDARAQAMSAPAMSAPAMSAPAMSAPAMNAAAAAMPQAAPQLPNPAQREPRDVPMFKAEAQAAAPAFAPAVPKAEPPRAPIAASAPQPSPQHAAPVAAPMSRHVPEPRPAIDPSLPPDTPLEPGSHTQRSAAERIAASQEAVEDLRGDANQPAGRANFIAAARRAAQAATANMLDQNAKKAEKSRVTSVLHQKAQAAAAATTSAAQSTFSNKLRQLLVGASVVVIVLATLRVGMNMMSHKDATDTPVSVEKSSALPSSSAMTQAPAAPAANTADVARAIPDPLERKMVLTPPANDAAASMVPAAGTLDARPRAAEPSARSMSEAPVEAMPVAPQPAPRGDVTGSLGETQSNAIPTPTPSPARITSAPVKGSLPEQIGSNDLRIAAQKGDAGAAFEIATRYAEGKGVPTDYDAAIKWYEAAAKGDIVPALFRLGSMHEKGLGVKKDAAKARDYYTQAADRGHAKAMHNLAVLYADGGGKNPDFKIASHWFRRAALHGIADSQYNLAILYARGIGVEQNLAESYKWFALAAAQGDNEAAAKRDDVAKRLDPQSLTAAKLAAQTFRPEAQPDSAIDVAAPAGGWDRAPKKAVKAAKKPTKTSAVTPH